MLKTYIKGALLLGAAALCCSNANAGAWRNLNNEVLEYPAFIKGWSGAISASDNNVAESWNGGFDLYQVINDMPAGDYTLQVSAFYRNWNDPAGAMNAFIYINGVKKEVCSIDDGNDAPWSRYDANAAFQAGRYVNTVSCTLAEAGPITIGIQSIGGYVDEWTCFGNVKLTGPEGDMTDYVVNADFSSDFNPSDNDAVDVWQEQVFEATRWNCMSYENKAKMPQLNLAGSLYTKSNCSGWNYGQKCELTPGKYRLSVQGLHCPGVETNLSGWGADYKSPFATPTEKTTALDNHNNGADGIAASLYATSGGVFDDDDEYKPLDLEDAQIDVPDAFFVEASLPCIFDEEMDVYIDNVNNYPFDVVEEMPEEGDRVSAYANATGHTDRDNGHYDEVIAYMVQNPDSYRAYVEFEVAETTWVWVGLKRDLGNDPSRHWTAFRDFKLEKWDDNAPDSINSVTTDENAPVEYYNIQGMRVNENAKGIVIMKQGNKVSKTYVR